MYTIYESDTLKIGTPVSTLTLKTRKINLE